MSKDKADKITIDGKEYALSALSEKAKMQLANINFVDERIQQLNNELAVSDTARMCYSNALKNEIASKAKDDQNG
jgi:lipid II:glycine glycyltransferase (peptidoglycan interpeptide bridge formation enzyme)